MTATKEAIRFPGQPTPRGVPGQPVSDGQRAGPGRRRVWAWAGWSGLAVVAIVLFSLDWSLGAVVIGAALATCLVMMGAMVWLDRRASRRR